MRWLIAAALTAFLAAPALAGFPSSGRIYPQGGGAWGTPTSIGVNGGTGATLAISGATVPAGDLIVVVVQERSASGAGTVADSASNTYTLAKSQGVSSLPFLQIFYAYNVAALSSQSITYTLKLSSHDAVISAFYISGEQTSSDPLDSAVTAGATGGSGSATVTSGTPGVSGELFVGAIGSTTSTFTQAAGWSAPPNSESFTAFAAGGNLINSGSGTETYAPSTGSTWTDIIIGFKHS